MRTGWRAGCMPANSRRIPGRSPWGMVSPAGGRSLGACKLALFNPVLEGPGESGLAANAAEAGNRSGAFHAHCTAATPLWAASPLVETSDWGQGTGGTAVTRPR